MLEQNNEFILLYLGCPYDKHMVENICRVGNGSYPIQSMNLPCDL